MKRSLHLIAGAAILFSVVGRALAVARDVSEPSSTVISNQNGDGRIEVLAQGDGPVIVLLPSLGRSAADFDAIAVRLASAGYRVLRPQPRGIGRSVAPMTGINLHDYAADVAAVIEQEKKGPAFVVGHAFGNRVARMLATDRPELVTAVALVAANVGKAPSTPKIREAIRNSANPALPEDERIKALQFAFFAPGNDARVWLQGWYPEVLAAERRAGDLTSREEDFAAGQAPILYLQPSHDPLAHVEDARAYRERFRDRVTVVVIERASHAVIVEQPDAVSAALIGYARKLWPHAALQ
jgi:pimeloyl-ACP methyl ester carboxylesterase